MKADFELVRLMAMSFQKIESIMELVMIPVEVSGISCFNLKGSGFLLCEPIEEGFNFSFLEREGVSLLKVAGFRREPIEDLGTILFTHPFLDKPLEAKMEELKEPRYFPLLLEIEAIAQKMPLTYLTLMKSTPASEDKRLVVYATTLTESTLSAFTPTGETKYLYDLSADEHEEFLEMIRTMKFESDSHSLHE